MKIEKFTLEDFESIKNNLIEDFDDFWNENQLKEELLKDNSYFIVAKDNDDIIGFAGILYNFDYNEIMNVVVRKNKRNHGIGKALLNKLALITKKQGKEKLILEVNENNVNAIKLYESFGFIKVGTRPNYYNGHDDCILMDLILKND